MTDLPNIKNPSARFLIFSGSWSSSFDNPNAAAPKANKDGIAIALVIPNAASEMPSVTNPAAKPNRFWNGMLANSTIEAVIVWMPVITKFPTVDTKVINPFISPNIVLDIVWMIGTITRAPNSTILPSTPNIVSDIILITGTNTFANSTILPNTPTNKSATILITGAIIRNAKASPIIPTVKTPSAMEAIVSV